MNIRSVLRIFIAIFATSAPILACLTNPGEVPLCYQFQSNQRIFVGKVVEIEAIPRNIDGLSERAAAWVPQYNRIEFVITEPFKLGEMETISMRALAKQVSSCDQVFPFKTGEEWLIYSKQDVNGEPSVTVAEPAEGSSKIESLRKMAHRGVVPAIHGQFFLGRVDSKGFGLIAESSTNRYLAAMDKYGQFSFDPVEPGVYRVKALFPFSGYITDGPTKTWFSFDPETSIHRFDFEVVVKENECFYKRFDARHRESINHSSVASE